jgi:phosphate transport system permease protein
VAAAQRTDRVAQLLISIGGLSVIAAVLGICVYLVWVAVPLFASGRAAPIGAPRAPGDTVSALLVDEYRRAALVVDREGRARRVDLSTGRASDPEQTAPADALSFDAAGALLATAAENRIVLSKASFRANGEAPSARVEEALTVEVPAGVVAVDAAETRRGTMIAAVNRDGSVRAWAGGRSRSALARESGAALRMLAPSARRSDEPIAGLLILADGSELAVIGQSGTAERFRIGRDAIELIGTAALLGAGEQISAVAPVLGRGSFVIGTSAGRLEVWSPVTEPDSAAIGGELVRLRELPGMPSNVTAITPSQRDRTIAAGDSSGVVAVIHATSAKPIARVEVGSAVQAVALSPKLDEMIAAAGGALHRFTLELGHPSATRAVLFGAVHYEGQREPSYTYQASAAADSAEPKLSIVPLVFGTIKATFFSMLIAAPLAILAAVFASEFLGEPVRRWLKPMVEMMASLPSVVLGFVAAMVVAPFVRDHLVGVLGAMVLCPLAVGLTAGTLALLPRAGRRLSGGWGVFVLAAAVVAMGLMVAVPLAGVVGSALFGLSEAEARVLAGLAEPAEASAPGAVRVGDGWYTPREPVDEAERERVSEIAAQFSGATSGIRQWLTATTGGAWPGWMALLAPSCALAVGLIGWPLALRVAPPLEGSRAEPLLRVAASSLAGVALGGLGAWLLTAWGFDARDSLLGAFTQRNTLVVSAVMGFAIVPIIFTLSDDAMRSVPVSLRAASLGAGATRWQTTLRVVLPVAASGIFSAVMIGLGRAVGETMIVLMATGNTPVIEWNVFSGLRTLSANIAVELPEAERGGTHYRILFLCGGVLFAMTLVINTTAELVRQRFRGRNARL